MRRRGQIFLLLTILSITFIFAVSTILLDIQRAQYLEPSPDIDETFEAWDNTVNSIEQILNVQIAIISQPGSGLGTGDYTAEIINELDALENYLLSRGLIASIDLDTSKSVYYNQTVPTPQVEIVSINASVLIQIDSSSGNSITQTLDFTIQYNATLDDNNDILYLSKTVNGLTNYIRGATFNVAILPNTDQSNGVYITIPTVLFEVTTPNNVVLNILNNP